MQSGAARWIGTAAWEITPITRRWPNSVRRRQATKLSDGKTVDQWITLRGSTGFAGGANVGGLDTIGGNQPIMQTYKDHVLELTFDADGKLVSWAKNY